jgi:2-oxo-3-hexenedioate decarboxylase
MDGVDDADGRAASSNGARLAWTRDMTKADLASDLEAARRGRYAITSRRGTRDAVSLDVAYELGQDLERERVSAGWRPAGWKLGFTNQALWSRLGLDRPIRARIYQETLCGADLDSAELVQPRIEPEIVVGFGADVPQMSDPEVIAAAVEWVAAGLEVVHCHFERWEMTPAEAVADAGVHAALAIGPRAAVKADAVRSLVVATCQLLLDGVVTATGSGADVLGGPLDALHWLLRGLPGGLRAGEIVTTGTLTQAMPLQPGQRWEHSLSASIELERVQLRIR